MRIFAEGKGTAPANGWVSREALSGNPTFWMEPTDACVYKPYDVTLHTEMKIEHYHGGQWIPFEYDNLYRNGHFSTVRNHIRDATDTALKTFL